VPLTILKEYPAGERKFRRLENFLEVVKIKYLVGLLILHVNIFAIIYWVPEPYGTILLIIIGAVGLSFTTRRFMRWLNKKRTGKYSSK